MNEILKINNASYTLPSGDELWRIESLSIAKNDKIGLIGKNGSGKSTLFECINGNKELTEGKIKKTEDSFYIPQQKNKEETDQTVEDIISSNKIKRDEFLSKFRSSFQDIGQEFTDKKLNHLSGGEYLKVFFTIASILNKKLLLLDEPTNHLDTKGISYLRSWLSSFQGAFICISHDTRFLDAVTKKIWSIENSEVKVYGGNYSFYKKMKEIEQESIIRQISNKNKELEKIQKTIALQNERTQKNEKKGRNNKKEKSKDKFAAGFHKDAAQKSGGKNISKLTESLSQVEKELDGLSLAKRMNLKLKIKNNISKGKIIDIKGGVLKIGNQELVKNINLEVSGGERIRIVGLNGTGKSYLLKSIINKNLREANLMADKFYFQENANTVYLDQFYDILNEEKTVLENVFDFSNGLTQEDARKHLSNMLFKDQIAINKKVKFLSGGEKVRVAIAMITSSNVDLLVLDEPTNNLDIETIDEFVDALQEFEGAIILITHNEAFSDSINITRKYEISNKNFKQI